VRKPFYSVSLTRADLRLLGVICTHWSQFEMLVDLWFAGVLKIPLTDSKLRRDISQKMTRLKTSVETNISDKTQRLHMLSVCDRGIAIALRRNLAIHGRWAMDSDKQSPVAVSWFKVRPPEKMKIMSASELPAIADEIADLTHEMQAFLTSQGVFPGA